MSYDNIQLMHSFEVKAAYSVTFDLLIFEIMFVFLSNTVKN